MKELNQTSAVLGRVNALNCKLRSEMQSQQLILSAVVLKLGNETVVSVAEMKELLGSRLSARGIKDDGSLRVKLSWPDPPICHSCGAMATCVGAPLEKGMREDARCAACCQHDGDHLPVVAQEGPESPDPLSAAAKEARDAVVQGLLNTGKVVTATEDSEAEDDPEEVSGGLCCHDCGDPMPIPENLCPPEPPEPAEEE